MLRRVRHIANTRNPLKSGGANWPYKPSVCPNLKKGLEKSCDTPYTIETLATKAETPIDACQRIKEEKMVWSG